MIVLETWKKQKWAERNQSGIEKSHPACNMQLGGQELYTAGE
jgi:hypothetical protein